MTSVPSKPHSRGGKRGACDRCRGQKLRCLREDLSQNSPQPKCVRCFRAGATCSFGIQKRAGRPPASNDPSPQERRGNGKKSGMASRATGNPSAHGSFINSKGNGGQGQRRTGERGRDWSVEENTAEQESEGEHEDTIPAHAVNPSSAHETSNVLPGYNLDFSTCSGSSTATLPWPDETLPTFYNTDAGEASGLESFGPEYGWAFQHFQAQPMDIQIPIASPGSKDEQFREVGIKPHGTCTETWSTNTQIPGTSDEAMDLDLPSRSAHAAPVNLAKALNVRPVGARDRDRESANFGISSTAKSALFRDLAEQGTHIKCDEDTISMQKNQHRRMQELSDLAMDLYAQLAAIDPGNHQPTSGATATAFQDQLVGNVLNSSNTFLTLLTSFSAPATPSSPLTPPPPSLSSRTHDNSICNSSDSGASPSSSTLDDDYPAMDGSMQHPPHKLPAGSSNASKPPSPTDTATVLQLLTCYVRIIHLHSIMYAHILDYMLALPPHNTDRVDSVPLVFPGMQVGGVSLDKFGTFQIKILLQISVHVLREIEVALGLPEVYRVGKRKGEGTGVLGASVSGEFVESLTKGRTKCVKEQLRSLRRVLKGADEF
jgi:hypothetical protein